MQDKALLLGFDTIVRSTESFTQTPPLRNGGDSQASRAAGAIRVHFMSSERQEAQEVVFRLLRECQISRDTATMAEFLLQTERCELTV